MRLKEDTSSWRSSGIIKRDFKHIHSEEPERPKSKKNKSKWCKGKPGVPHEYESKTPKNGSKFYKLDVCKNCGRQSFTNTQWYCRTHGVWDTHIYWNENHTHATTGTGQPKPLPNRLHAL